MNHSNQSIVFSAAIILILGLILNLSGQTDRNFYQNQKMAFAAKTQAECQQSLNFCRTAIKQAANHPVLNYLLARLNEKLGHRKNAIRYLKKAAQLGYTTRVRWLKIHPGNDPAFVSLRKEKIYQEIESIMAIVNKSVHRSEIAFVVKDKEIGTEGIAYDPVEKQFYMGSSQGIVKVDLNGNTRKFTREAGIDKLGWVNGIHIDSDRRILWACSNDENRSEVIKFNLTTGRSLKKYILPSDGKRHMFNDLVIHPNGDIYITDTLGGTIFVIRRETDTLAPFSKSPKFSGLNGITLSDDGRQIFASSNVGIFKIEIQTKRVFLLTHEKNFHSYGIDGLYLFDNQLYAIQNELLTQVSRFTLNRKGTHLKTCEIFEKNTHNLRAPTTGAIAGDYFYFIANSNWRKPKTGVVVMKTRINNKKTAKAK